MTCEPYKLMTCIKNSIKYKYFLNSSWGSNARLQIVIYVPASFIYGLLNDLQNVLHFIQTLCSSLLIFITSLREWFSLLYPLKTCKNHISAAWVLYFFPLVFGLSSFPHSSTWAESILKNLISVLLGIWKLKYFRLCIFIGLRDKLKSFTL